MWRHVFPETPCVRLVGGTVGSSSLYSHGKKIAEFYGSVTDIVSLIAPGNSFLLALLKLGISCGLQNEYIEEHIKRHGRRLDYFERK